MAQFRAVIKGQRGEASRLGSKVSGIHAEVNGWNSGVSVYGAVHNDGHGEYDAFGIYITGGSNGAIREQHIGTVLIDVSGKITFRVREDLQERLANA